VTRTDLGHAFIEPKLNPIHEAAVYLLRALMLRLDATALYAAMDRKRQQDGVSWEHVSRRIGVSAFADAHR
jgi:hypothetical protein